MNRLDFLKIPWQTVSRETANSFQKELHNKLPDDHMLYGKPAISLANRIDNDDVIFWIDELNKFAVVHLTWSSNNSSGFPKTELFSLDDLRNYCKRVSDFY